MLDFGVSDKIFVKPCAFNTRSKSRTLGTAGSVMIIELSINGMLALKKLWSDARRQDWLVQKLGCGDFKGLTTRFRDSLLFSSSLDQEDKRRPCSRGVSDVKNGVLIFLARMFFRNDTFYVKTRLFLCGEI